LRDFEDVTVRASLFRASGKKYGFVQGYMEVYAKI
jgi:hypothetical protein